MDSVRISVEKVASKYAVLQSLDWSAPHSHAAIPYVGMVLFNGMIMIGGEVWRPRMGVG